MSARLRRAIVVGTLLVGASAFDQLDKTKSPNFHKGKEAIVLVESAFGRHDQKLDKDTSKTAPVLATVDSKTKLKVDKKLPIQKASLLPIGLFYESTYNSLKKLNSEIHSGPLKILELPIALISWGVIAIAGLIDGMGIFFIAILSGLGGVVKWTGIEVLGLFGCENVTTKDVLIFGGVLLGAGIVIAAIRASLDRVTLSSGTPEQKKKVVERREGARKIYSSNGEYSTVESIMNDDVLDEYYNGKLGPVDHMDSDILIVGTDEARKQVIKRRELIPGDKILDEYRKNNNEVKKYIRFRAWIPNEPGLDQIDLRVSTVSRRVLNPQFVNQNPRAIRSADETKLDQDAELESKRYQDFRDELILKVGTDEEKKRVIKRREKARTHSDEAGNTIKKDDNVLDKYYWVKIHLGEEPDKKD